MTYNEARSAPRRAPSAQGDDSA